MKGRIVLATAAALLTAAAALAEGSRIERSFELASGASLVVKSEAGDVIVRGVDGDRATVVITPRQSDFEAKYDVVFEHPGPDRLDGDDRAEGPRAVQLEHQLVRRAPRDRPAALGRGRPAELGRRRRSLGVERQGAGQQLGRRRARFGDRRGRRRVEQRRRRRGRTTSRARSRLESSGGGVKARNVGGDIDASSSGGGVRIEEARGAVIADSSGGPVRVGFAAGNAKGGDLSSSGGGVEARVDPAVGLEIDAHSSGGGLDCDLPVTVRGKISKSTLRGQLNGGGALLKIRSSGGGIDIETR